MTRYSPLSYVALSTLALSTTAEIYFKEQFADGWRSRWVEPSNWKSKEEMGKWEHTAGKWYGDANDKGIQTSEDARFYGLSAKMTKPITTEGKDLVLQYTVKHEQNIDCGGAYIKLLGPGVDQASFGGDTPYQIMFGPDICGSTKRTHLIFHYEPKKDNLLIKNDIRTESDQVSHLYTLHLKKDGTFDVLIDGTSARSGKLEDEFDFLPPKKIKDPNQSKPADWVDEAMIPDPEDKKPDGYDDVPELIPDPEASKPEDWDDDEDGEWEAPMISNPAYQGEWKPKMISNPAYKGEWVHPEIDNPDYKEDPELAVRCKDCSYVGFELWQVKSGTIFDDIIVTDSIEEANEFAQETFYKKKDGEKAMFDKADEERREKEKKEREEAMKKMEEEQAKQKESGAEGDESVEYEEDDDDGFGEEL